MVEAEIWSVHFDSSLWLCAMIQPTRSTESMIVCGTVGSRSGWRGKHLRCCVVSKGSVMRGVCRNVSLQPYLHSSNNMTMDVNTCILWWLILHTKVLLRVSDSGITATLARHSLSSTLDIIRSERRLLNLRREGRPLSPIWLLWYSRSHELWMNCYTTPWEIITSLRILPMVESIASKVYDAFVRSCMWSDNLISNYQMYEVTDTV